MNKYEELFKTNKSKLQKAIKYLRYSYNKVTKLPNEVDKLNEESLDEK